MPIFSKGKSNILFIHIPKSAGSTVEKIGANLGWEESFSVRGKSLPEINYYKVSLQHLHAEPLSKILNLEEFESIFTIVRNPFERFKSEYYWQKHQGITQLPVDSWITDTFEKYIGDSYIYDNHIRPQVEFIPRSSKVEIFKLEEGGVKSAKEIFSNLSKESKNVYSSIKQLKSLFDKNRIKKQSIKDMSTEAQFVNHYERIVEFYEKDYSFLLYKI